MCTVRLCSFETAQALKAAHSCTKALSSFCAGDHLFWWDAAPEEYETGHCLSSYCHEHSESLREHIATLMQNVGRRQVEGKEVQAWLSFDDSLSPWYTSLLFEKHPQILPHLFAACKLHAFIHLIEKDLPACTHMVLHVADRRLREALQHYCQEKNITFSYAPPDKKNFSFKPLPVKKHLIKLFTCLPTFCQSLLRFGHWLWILRRLIGKKTQCKPLCRTKALEQNTIATYFPHVHRDLAQKNIFRSSYWEILHEPLERVIKKGTMHIHWLFIRVNSAQYFLKKSITLKEALQKKAEQEGRSESFYYVEEFLSFTDIRRAFRHYILIKKRAAHIENKLHKAWTLGSSTLSLWPFFRDAWQESFGGWRCLERCLQQEAFKGYAAHLQQNSPKFLPHGWTLFPWENCPWERRLTESMRKAFPQSKVYAVQHSSLRKTDFRYFDGKAFFLHAQENPALELSLPHIYCLNGQHAMENIQNHIPAEKIGQVEALRYAYLPNLQAKHPLFSQPQVTSTAPIQHLVLICSYFAQEVDAHMQSLAAWWHEHKQSQNFTGNIYIKAHPHTSVKAYLHKYNLPQNAITFLTMPMENFWQQVHLWQAKEENTLLWLANSTTVALEAASMNMPLCVQRPTKNFSLCPLDGMEGLIYVQSAQEVQKALTMQARVCLPPHAFFLENSLPRWKSLLFKPY